MDQKQDSITPQNTNNKDIVSVVLSENTLDSICKKVENTVKMYMASNYESIKYIQNTVFKGLCYNKEDGHAYYIKEKVFSNHKHITDNQEKIVEKLNTIIDNQAKIIESQNQTIESLSSTVKKQHEEITRFKDDMIFKTKKEPIMEIIGIADQLKSIINDQTDSSNQHDIIQRIKELDEWTDSSLEILGVRKTTSLNTEQIDRQHQEIVEIINTTNPLENGKLKSLLPGYVWTIPMANNSTGNNELVIRHEQMAQYKYTPETRHVITESKTNTNTYNKLDF